jgi:enoyl-CoA hydratase/carnithine racemase
LSGRVNVDIDSGIAVVTLNRPDKHNALDRESFDALIAAGERLATDLSLRAVVLAGAGESFCAGIDRSIFEESLREGDAADNAALLRPRGELRANLYQSASLVWRQIPVPVIAAIHGVAYGAGLQIALGADFRIAAPDSRLSLMEIRWGIIPDMGITVTLRHIVAPDRIKLLAITGKVIDGLEARSAGIVTDVDDQPFLSARLLAEQICGRSPEAVRAIKQLMNFSFEEPVERALRREADLQLSLIGSANQREAVMANLHKREPRYRDPQK